MMHQTPFTSAEITLQLYEHKPNELLKWHPVLIALWQCQSQTWIKEEGNVNAQASSKRMDLHADKTLSHHLEPRSRSVLPYATYCALVRPTYQGRRELF